MSATTGSDILAMHAAQAPDRPAFISEDGSAVTYQAFNQRVNRFVRVLQRLGLRPGERCVHVHYNCVEAFELSHAVRKLRAVGTPMNNRLRGHEIAYILNDSAARVIVAGPEFLAAVDEARAEVSDADSRHWLAFGDNVPAGWTSYEELVAAESDAEPDLVTEITGPTMVYTAGTTGNPKGAFRPKGADPSVVMQWIVTFGFNPADVHLLAGPGYHSAPAAFSGVQQIVGATTVIMKRFDPTLALRLIERHRVTTTFMAPILVKRILDLPENVRGGFDLSSLRVLVVAAAPFPADVKRRAAEFFGDVVYEFYGATETGIVTLVRPEDLLRKPESCGKPFEGQEVRLLDDEGNEVPVGQPGELWARSNALFGEYLNKPEATERNFRDGFFTVGDIAYQDDEGFIYICDRKVDMIISGGTNIYPAEVEATLHAHPAVEDCAIIGVPDPDWGEAVKAVVKLHQGRAASADELKTFCRERLADYKCPRSVDFVDDFPRDAAGKLLKRLIRDRYWEQTGHKV